MGKVASSALTQALNRADLRAHQIHNLDTESLLQLAKTNLDAGSLPLRHVSQAMAYRNEYQQHPERFLFISVVRDPIARNMSAFFQNLAKTENNDVTDNAALFERFVTTYYHALPLVWFDRQFDDNLGIDVFKKPFDRVQRYSYLRSQNTLLFRIDCPRTTQEKLLSDVYHRPIHIFEANVGDKKAYSARYKAFKAHAHFDAALLDQIYDSKFCRHFWTDQEREDLRKKWTK